MKITFFNQDETEPIIADVIRKNYKNDFVSFPLEEQTKNNLRSIMSTFAPFSGKPMPTSQPASQVPATQVEVK